MLKNGLAILAMMPLFTIGCAREADFGDADVVLQYIIDEEAGAGGFSFTSGDYQDGTAVLSGQGLAFWVKDGVGYTVNEAARAVAPDLEQAPEHIQFDDDFQAAAHQP